MQFVVIVFGNAQLVIPALDDSAFYSSSHSEVLYLEIYQLHTHYEGPLLMWLPTYLVTS